MSIESRKIEKLSQEEIKTIKQTIVSEKANQMEYIMS